MVKGARHHNLKNISLSIPAGAITVITGRSGSGKSTLAANVLFAEGSFRYIQSLGSQDRREMRLWERPDVDAISNIPPPLLLEQKKPHGRGYHSSTVATLTGLKTPLRMLFSTAGEAFCPKCHIPVRALTIDQIGARLTALEAGSRLVIMAPALTMFRNMGVREALSMLQSQGFLRVILNGELFYTDQDFDPPQDMVQADIVIDRIVIKEGASSRISESAALALRAGNGILNAEITAPGSQPHTLTFTDRPICPSCHSLYPNLEPHLFSSLEAGAGKAQSRETEEGVREYIEAVQVHGLSWYRVLGLTASEANEWIVELRSHITSGKISNIAHADAALSIIASMEGILKPVTEMGLGYLHLDTETSHLSTGEIQRLRIGAQLTRNMSGVLYILDEPTTGLHPSEHAPLWNHINRLKEQGNTVLIVEHDLEIVKKADWIIELGPGAGENGGKILFSGRPGDLKAAKNSVTAPWLDNQRGLYRKKVSPGTLGWIEFTHLQNKNLKDVSLMLPAASLTCITGLSGSGKSALVQEMASLALSFLQEESKPSGNHVLLHGTRACPEPLIMDQSPITGSVASMPATVMNIFGHIRKLFARTPEARKKGITAGWFSLNKRGGRCERCRGRGKIVTELKFLPPVESVCDVCQGRRYKQDVLSIFYKGKSIADVLDMSVTEAANLFSRISVILHSLEWLERAGLGYLKLGQHTSTLSGGEAQRLKLARELSAKRRNRSLFILDEPTMGLHPEDINIIMTIFNDLIDQGHTVVVVEHEMRLAAASDYIVELGPGSGPEGGEIVFQGTPLELVERGDTPTAGAIESYLKR